MFPNPVANDYKSHVVVNGVLTFWLISTSVMSASIVERGFSVMAIIVGYEARSTHFLWSIEPSTSLAPFAAF